MKMSGLEFIRYADDIVVLCDSEKASKTALSRIASILDKQQRLMIQRHKTKFYKPEEFQDICRKMIEDRPIDKNEERLLKIINKYTKGDRYKTISYNSISPSDWTNFSSDVVEGIIKDYLSKDDIDYIRLRWFYRRLAQVGHPGAVSVSIENIEVLQPCLANICFYISSVQSIEPDAWKQLGKSLIKLLDKDEIKESEFFRLSILSLFARNKHFNHFARLASQFQSSDAFARREILLAAFQNGAADWLRARLIIQ